MSTWTWLNFESETTRTIGHAVHVSTRKAVIADLVARGCGSPVEIPIDEDGVHIDMPGMIAMTRPIEVFEMGGLRINIPSEDVAAFLIDVDKLKVRHGADGSDYYKLHGFMRALVLSPSQRTMFRALLVGRVPTAERRASEFYAVNMLPSEVLRQAAAASSGRPVDEIPNLGANRQDRFKAGGVGSGRKVGQA